MASPRPLNQILDELRQALEHPAELADRDRDALQAAARGIRTALRRVAEEEEGDESLADQLKDALERFEGQHPKLTQAVGRVADALSDLGI